MFSSLISAGQIAGLYLADRGVLALRWGLEAVRGYQRAADMREGLVHQIRMGDRAAVPDVAERYADWALETLRAIEDNRAEPGPLGAGARLAVSPAEFVELRVAAENLRSEAIGRGDRERGA